MPTRYRAENVGSLLRTPELLAARAAYAAGNLRIEDLRAAEDRSILQVFEGQRKAGIDIYTDGEQRRGSWMTDMAEACEGFVSNRVMREWKGPGGGMEGSTANAVGGKLRKLRKMNESELPFLKRNAPGPYKVTLPAPSNFMLASYQKGITDKVYPDRDEMLDDLVKIVRDEIQWLVSGGVPYIQLDNPFYPHYQLDPRQTEIFQEMGLDGAKEFEKGVAADNRSIAGISRDKVTVACHVCRGNSRSRWTAEGGYDAMAEQLFNGLEVDTFLLEYDTARAGGFEPLRHMPRRKTVVLGLVTSKEPELEPQEELLRRIEEASRFMPLENLALSSQCGFASVAAGNLLSMDDQWRKLELVADTARKVWG